MSEEKYKWMVDFLATQVNNSEFNCPFRNMTVIQCDENSDCNACVKREMELLWEKKQYKDCQLCGAGAAIHPNKKATCRNHNCTMRDISLTMFKWNQLMNSIKEVKENAKEQKDD